MNRTIEGFTARIPALLLGSALLTVLACDGGLPGPVRAGAAGASGASSSGASSSGASSSGASSSGASSSGGSPSGGRGEPGADSGGNGLGGTKVASGGASGGAATDAAGGDAGAPSQAGAGNFGGGGVSGGGSGGAATDPVGGGAGAPSQGGAGDFGGGGASGGASGGDASAGAAPVPTGGVAGAVSQGGAGNFGGAGSGGNGSGGSVACLGSVGLGGPPMVEMNGGGAVRMGDVNGDGRVDLVVAQSHGPAVAVLLNSGDGSWAQRNEYLPLDVASALALADVNRDGFLDIVVSVGGFAVLLNDGTGRFSESGRYAAGSALQLIAEDVDNDQYPDVIATGYDAVYVSFNTGKGGFVPPLGLVLSEPRAAAVADLNGDGFRELVVTHYFKDGDAGRQVSVLMNQHGRTFAPPVYYPVAEWPRAVAAADLDGDLDRDVVVASEFGLNVLPNDGTGKLGATVNYPLGPEALAVELADLDSDHRRDVIVANRSGGSVQVFLNEGAGSLAPPKEYLAGSFPYSLGLGDLNGDGLLDFASVTDIGDLSIGLNEGHGAFAAGIRVSRGVRYEQVIAADLSGDGHPDLATISAADGSLDVYLNPGAGNFLAAPVQYPLATPPRALAAGDFDGDGRADLAISTSDGVLLRFGKGLLGLSAPTVVSEPADALAARDLNGDGRVDLALAIGSKSSLVVLWNLGAGVLGQASSYPGLGAPNHLVLDDFDADGAVDIVASSDSKDQVSIWFNRGARTFAPMKAAYLGPGARAWVTSADLNGDGSPDLAVANGSSGLPVSHEISVLFNSGGAFTLAGMYRTNGTHPIFVTPLDLDQDRSADLAVINLDQRHPLSVLGNRGDGTFRAARSYSAGIGFDYGDIAVADFDGDGRSDLAMVGSASDGIRIFRSSCWAHANP